jgi:formiminoglutamase
MTKYKSTSPNLWQGHIDGTSKDVLRWHQVIQHIDLDEKDPEAPLEYQQGIALLGFCCDAGAEKSRPGAKLAPTAIRRACCNLPFIESETGLFDAGDVFADKDNPEPGQQLLGEKIKQLRRSGYLPIVLGGGHEVSYGIFSGLQPFPGKAEFGIISFDAHFNLQEAGYKGAFDETSIWQMRQFCQQQGHPFHYVAIGIQQYFNTRKLFARARDIAAVHFLAEDFTNDQLEHLLQVVNGIIGNCDLIQLSLDMDVFASAHAPGVNTPTFNGIAPNSMFKRLLRHIMLSGKVASVDISGANPEYDENKRTINLAASIVFDLVQAADKNAAW